MIKCIQKLAICILTYNRIHYLKKTIDSVFKNNSNEYDLIIINDCSTDGTNEHLDILKKKGLLREIRNKKNSGQFINANFILSNVPSRYCIILHDDDALEPTHIEKVLDLAESDKDIAIVSTGWNGIDENDKIISTNIYSEFLEPHVLDDKEYFYHYFKGLNFQWSGSLIRMNKVKDLRFNDMYRPFRDMVFLSNLALGNKIGYIPEPLFNYRIHKSQQTKKLQQDFSNYYKYWFKAFDYTEGFIKQNKIGEESMQNFKISRNKTVIWFLTVLTNDFKTFFEIFFSGYLSFYLLKPNQYLKIFRKLIKMILRINTKH